MSSLPPRINPPANDFLARGTSRYATQAIYPNGKGLCSETMIVEDALIDQDDDISGSDTFLCCFRTTASPTRSAFLAFIVIPLFFSVARYISTAL